MTIRMHLYRTLLKEIEDAGVSWQLDRLRNLASHMTKNPLDNRLDVMFIYVNRNTPFPAIDREFMAMFIEYLTRLREEMSEDD